MERIIINYNGWVSVDKNDLKIQKFGEDIINSDFVDVETTNMTAEEIAKGLEKGLYFLKSFADTLKNDAIDGEEDLVTFDVDNDEF